MEVHAEFKSGLLEAVYAEAMTIELENRGIEFESEVNLPIYYKGTLMQKKNIVWIYYAEMLLLN